MYNLISIDDILTGELSLPSGFDPGHRLHDFVGKQTDSILSGAVVYSLIELSIILYNKRLERLQLRPIHDVLQSSIRAVLHCSDISECNIQQTSKLTQAVYTAVGGIKPNDTAARVLSNLSALLVFLEPSTRTMLSFASAIQDLGMHTITFPEFSSMKKGESITDTMHTLNAMMRHIMVIRSAIDDLGPVVDCLPDCIVVNAGNGRTEHPTQALLDAATIFFYKKKLSGIKVAICGDTLNSRVAKSGVKLLAYLGADVFIISPKDLTMDIAAVIGPAAKGKVIISNEITPEVLSNLDVLMILRIQKERLINSNFSEEQYIQHYCITQQHFEWLPKDAIVMHPGPMNRNVEIAADVLGDFRIVFDAQVRMGVCMRNALLGYLLMINGLIG